MLTFPIGAQVTQAGLPTSLADFPLLPPSSKQAPLVLPAIPAVTTSSSGGPRMATDAAIPKKSPIAPAIPPFTLASSLPPIPGKLASRIQALEFVEMRDLLPDNIALGERLEALPSHTAHLKAPETRNIGSLYTWVSAYSTYVAIVAEVHPDRVKDMLAYMRLLVREASNHGGQGWLTYDQVFRRNRAGTNQRWDQLDPSLHISYIVTHGGPVSKPCGNCNEVDHATEECALTPLVPAPKFSPLQHSAIAGESRPTRCTVPGRLAQPAKRICLSWNKGRCMFPGSCNYQHICASCREPHPQRDCPHYPQATIARPL